MEGISSLPDGIISHILSFLPIKKAARTSVLSKRWRVLFAFSPNLDFLVYEKDKRQSFKAFIDRLLAVSGNSPIKKFSVRCGKGFDPAHINRWIVDVLKRGVLDLSIDVGMNAEDDVLSLPFEIFTCKTLLELKLTGFSINVLPEDAFLPALKTLSLRMVSQSVHVCAFEKLLSACPILEELTMDYLNWEYWKCSRTVSSLTLERLTLRRSDFDGFDGSDFGSISFDTPNLTYLYYSDFIPGSYPNVNLSSLVEANLNLIVTVDHTWNNCFADENDNITSNPTNLIEGLRDVKIMNLLSVTSLEMFYFFREAIPVFENLFHLSFVTITGCCWRGLPFLLENSPNLETLIIKGPLHYCEDGEEHESVCECLSGYSCLSSCPVKVVKLEYTTTKSDLEHLKHLLGKLPCLELLEVKIWGTSDVKFQQAKDLLMLTRASSKCKIKII